MSGCIFSLLVLAIIFTFLTRIVPRLLDSSAVERIWREPSGKAFSVLSVALAFDPDHALVWETQIPILQLISTAGPHGISIRRLHQAYLESARHYPELYEGSSFKTWLEFLEHARLAVCPDGQRVLLTSQGSDFLHYRITAHEVVPLSSPERQR